MTVDAGSVRTTPQMSAWLGASAGTFVAVVAANAVAGSQRWWANFVLLPGAAAVAAAVPLMRAGGRRVAAGYAVLCGAAVVSTVGALLLFGAMGRAWPLMVVLPCLAVAGTARWRAPDANARAAHRAWWGSHWSAPRSA